MGGRNPERDRPSCAPDTELATWARSYPDWRICITCDSCAHAGLLNPSKLLKGGEAPHTIFEVQLRARCGQCGKCKFNVTPKWVGKRRD